MQILVNRQRGSHIPMFGDVNSGQLLLIPVSADANSGQLPVRLTHPRVWRRKFWSIATHPYVRRCKLWSITSDDHPDYGQSPEGISHPHVCRCKFWSITGEEHSSLCLQMSILVNRQRGSLIPVSADVNSGQSPERITHPHVRRCKLCSITRRDHPSSCPGIQISADPIHHQGSPICRCQSWFNIIYLPHITDDLLTMICRPSADHLPTISRWV
jgi:hypothetical protein